MTAKLQEQFKEGVKWKKAIINDSIKVFGQADEDNGEPFDDQLNRIIVELRTPMERGRLT